MDAERLAVAAFDLAAREGTADAQVLALESLQVAVLAVVDKLVGDIAGSGRLRRLAELAPTVFADVRVLVDVDLSTIEFTSETDE